MVRVPVRRIGEGGLEGLIAWAGGPDDAVVVSGLAPADQAAVVAHLTEPHERLFGLAELPAFDGLEARQVDPRSSLAEFTGRLLELQTATRVEVLWARATGLATAAAE